MNLRRITAGVLIMLFLTSVLFNVIPVIAQVSSATTFYVDPASISDPGLTPGSSFTVNVNVSDAVDLYAYQIYMTWNPSILNATTITFGDFLAGQPEGTFPFEKIDQDLGYCLIGETTIGQYPGVDGDGWLASVEFLVIATGETVLDISGGEFNLTYYIDSYLDTFYPTTENGYFSNVPVQPASISIYTDKYSYSAGDTMYLGLDMTNTVGHAITVCIAVWLEMPGGARKVILHAHAVTLPDGLDYSNPAFMSFMLPSIPAGIYTWHAAFLNPATHSILLHGTAEWQFV